MKCKTCNEPLWKHFDAVYKMAVKINNIWYCLGCYLKGKT